MQEQYGQEHMSTIIEKQERAVHNKRYNLVVASMFKNENSVIKEWLDHNIAVGVEHFYLIDNGSTDGYANILHPYMHRGLVTLVADPRRWKHGDESSRQMGIRYEMATSTYTRAQWRTLDNRFRNTQNVLLNEHFLRLLRGQS